MPQTRKLPPRSQHSGNGPFVVAAVLVAAIITSIVWAWIHFGVQIYKIGSGSMNPTLPPGTLVITVSRDTLAPGDIITFRQHSSAGEVVTHRYIGDAPDGSLRTQGDANPSPDNFDQPIRQSDVVGVLWRHVDILTAEFWLTWRAIMLIVCLALLPLGLRLLFSDSSKKKKEEGDCIPV